MFNKILTISVAAYNVECYLRNALESLVVPQILNDIEVFVIDDGGIDNSYQISKDFETKFPNTFKAVHKKNAGYGSTVNYSIKHANGKYFKLLDGDDWFDKDGLYKLVKLLKNVDSDVVVTEFKRHFGDKVLDGITFPKNYYDKLINISDFIYMNGIQMHAITYKTEILRTSSTHLSENMLYTDNEFDAYPISKAKTILIKSFSVYNYRLGQINQSVNIDMQIKHIDILIYMSYKLVDYYEKCKKEKINAIEYLCSRVAATCVDTFAIIVRAKNRKEFKNKIIDFDNMIFNKSKDVYNRMGMLDRKNSKLLFFLRFTNYFAYSIVSLLLRKN